MKACHPSPLSFFTRHPWRRLSGSPTYLHTRLCILRAQNDCLCGSLPLPHAPSPPLFPTQSSPAPPTPVPVLGGRTLQTDTQTQTDCIPASTTGWVIMGRSSTSSFPGLLGELSKYGARSSQYRAASTGFPPPILPGRQPEPWSDNVATQWLISELPKGSQLFSI